jgi:hypothetical protein
MPSWYDSGVSRESGHERPDGGQSPRDVCCRYDGELRTCSNSGSTDFKLSGIDSIKHGRIKEEDETR